MQKTLILTIAAIAASTTVAFGSCGKPLKGSGKLVTRTIPVSAFHEVKASRAVKVILTEGTSGQLTVEADDNLIDHVMAEVAYGVLKMGIDPKIKSVSNAHITFTVPTDGRIGSLEANSAAAIYTQNIVLTGTEVELEASCAAKIDVSATADRCKTEASSAAEIIAVLTADECKAEASSAAVIELEGTVRTCEADINTAANLSAKKLTVSFWDINASSGSNARIHCTETLEAQASGGASIVYTGDCTVNTHTSSGGSIMKR